MLTTKKSAAFVLPVLLAGLLSAGVAPQDELEDMRRLLELQEQQLDLLQQQIKLTRGRIQELSGAESGGALVEVEAKAVHVVTQDEGEFQRLVDLPGNEGGFTLVLDGEEYEALLAKVAGVPGASVVSRPKIAIRDGVPGEVANTAEVPYFNERGEPVFASVGFRFSLRPQVLSATSMALTVDVDGSVQTGQVTFPGEDGGERTVPLISSRRVHSRVQLQRGQGVVLGGLSSKNVATGELEHLLYFARPRVVPPREADDD